MHVHRFRQLKSSKKYLYQYVLCICIYNRCPAGITKIPIDYQGPSTIKATAVAPPYRLRMQCRPRRQTARQANTPTLGGTSTSYSCPTLPVPVTGTILYTSRCYVGATYTNCCESKSGGNRNRAPLPCLNKANYKHRNPTHILPVALSRSKREKTIASAPPSSAICVQKFHSGCTPSTRGVDSFWSP